MALNSVQKISLIGGRQLHIPPGGWDAASFIEHGARMIQTLARVANITQRQTVPQFARTTKAIFDGQLKRIVRRAEQSRQHFRLGFRSLSIKAEEESSIILNFPQEEQLWKEAIDFVLNTADVEIVTAMTPPIQSVMAQGYSKTAYLIGEKLDATINGAITRQARDMAAKIVQVNDTTRDNILNAVKDAVKQQMTVKETAGYIEERVGTIFGNRSLTIARTELNKAWTEGAAISYKQSQSITELSVIGCEAREKNSPQYEGESTCNYEGLPVDKVDEFLAVGFHPNHTGTLVPSGFASDSDE